MLGAVLRTLAIVASLILVASFGLFTRDQLAHGSEDQQVAVADGQPVASVPVATVPAKQPRRFIDGAAQRLLSPFSALATASSGWGERTLPTLVALLVYGLGLGFLSRSAVLTGRRSPVSRT